MNPVDADIKRYAETMPQYRETLDFLQKILDFQATLAKKIEADLQIESATAFEKWERGQPLLTNESLSISPFLFQEALVDLRSWLPEGSAQMALDQLLDSSFMTSPNVEALLDNLVSGDETYIRQVADAIATNPDTLALLLRIVLSPFFEKQAAPYRQWVETAAWRRGICPMCGSEPVMARLSHDDGRRILACSLCRTEWIFDRLRCPFCESEGQPLLRHFTVDDDKAHRVDCCDRCQRYLKTVDERVSGRPASLPVEEVITTHLDVLAREQGYQ
jgi:FdhE protein